MQVSMWLSDIVFHSQQILLQTLGAINSESYQRSFSSFVHCHLNLLVYPKSSDIDFAVKMFDCLLE